MTKKWYVVHAYSGFEKQVARALQERVDLSELTDSFGEILVPTEEVVDHVVALGEEVIENFCQGWEQGFTQLANVDLYRGEVEDAGK